MSIWGICPAGCGTFHVTEAGHAKLCLVVVWFEGEMPPSREAGPPDHPQRDLRRPLAQPRLAATPP